MKHFKLLSIQAAPPSSPSPPPFSSSILNLIAHGVSFRGRLSPFRSYEIVFLRWKCEEWYLRNLARSCSRWKIQPGSLSAVSRPIFCDLNLLALPDAVPNLFPNIIGEKHIRSRKTHGSSPFVSLEGMPQTGFLSVKWTFECSRAKLHIKI